MTLTADLRMYRHSGIGRYLRNLFPLLLPLLEVDRIRILADPAVLRGADIQRTSKGPNPDGPEGAGLQSRHKHGHRTAALAAEANAPGAPVWMSDPRIQLIETTAPIYSLQEQFLATNPTDLLWVPHYNAPLFHRGRTVVTIHDLAPLAIPQIFNSALKRAYAQLLLKRAVANASAILCVSEFTRSELAARLHVPAGKMTVTPLALDTSWPTSAVPHAEPDGVPYLLYVGNIKPNKNLSLLLNAFATVQDRLPHRLVLAGKLRGFSTGDEPVLRQAESMGDRVRLAGEVDDAQLQSLYAGASALVLPSLYEGFGLPVLEAMSLNCPVLSSTAGSLPEVAGDAALYFNPHSVPELAACLLQTQDAPTRDHLRTLGHARITGFSFTRCAQQTATVLNRQLHQSTIPQQPTTNNQQPRTYNLQPTTYMPQTLTPALFLDRDGVINHDTGYIYRIPEIRWVEGIFPLAQTAVRLGYKLVVVTNQSGIARGLYTEADFHALMDWMRSEFAARNAPLDAVYFSPHHPVHGIGVYKREHQDRKPGPGMLLRAARDLNLNLSASILVGDRCSDIAAANAADLRQAFLLTGTETAPCPGHYLPITTLAELQDWLEQP